MTSVSTRSKSRSAGPTSRSAAKSLSQADRLERNNLDFDILRGVAEDAATVGNVEQTLAAAAFAARLAAGFTIGRLMDERLEAAVARAIRGGDAAPTVDHGRRDGHVLHVLTEASGTQGQSKSAVRWVAKDPTPADVAITHQAHVITLDVRTVVEGAGGYIHNLRKPVRNGVKGVYESTLWERAQSLRAAMDQADLVVLHTMPHDPVPLAAASLPGERPPIITKNYFADKFWLGWSITDLIANCSSADELITTEARGIARSRQVLVPPPIDKSGRIASRADLRTQMLFTDRDVVALCIAAPQKLHAENSLGFADVVARLLKAVPELSVILVGPEVDGRWKQLTIRYPGRIHALGVLAEAQALFPVADLYLDSYPQPGPMAVLEAEAAGLPVVRLQLQVGATDTSTTERHVVVGLDPYISRVKQLTRSKQLREQEARANQHHVEAVNTGAQWQNCVDSLYERARRPVLATEHACDPVEPPVPSTASPQRRMSFDELIEPYRTVLDEQFKPGLRDAWNHRSQE